MHIYIYNVCARTYKKVKLSMTPFGSKTKILRIKEREYRDGIKSKETRPDREAYNVYKACVGITEGFKANMCT